jgi:hypothetical protein
MALNCVKTSDAFYDQLTEEKIYLSNARQEVALMFTWVFVLIICLPR